MVSSHVTSSKLDTLYDKPVIPLYEPADKAVETDKRSVACIDRSRDVEHQRSVRQGAVILQLAYRAARTLTGILASPVCGNHIGSVHPPAALVVVAIASRLGVTWHLWDPDRTGMEYGNIAAHLVQGRGFAISLNHCGWREPPIMTTRWMMPFYPLVLAGSKLTATDLRNFIKADDVVQILNDCIRLVADRQHVLEDIRNGFVTRGFSLKTIADMRIAKLEEVWVDGTRETDND